MQRLSEINVKNFLDSSFEAAFVLKSVEVRPQKPDKECMTLIMKDKDTEVEAKIFNISSVHKEGLKAGKVYGADIKVKKYEKSKTGISCIIEDIPYELDLQAEAFADWVEDYDRYNQKLGELLSFVNDSKYGKIAYDIIQNRWDKFSMWGAAKSNHHTSLGGLLMHTVTVAEGCKQAGELYNKIYGSKFINIKLLVSAALLHDVMKTEELVCESQSGSMDYSTESSLTTHIVEIAIEVEKSAIKLGIEDRNVVNELKHCLLAHHGKLEYGSPITPSCMEAIIVNHMDELDAAGWRYGKACKNMSEHERTTIWVGNQPFSVFKTTVDSDMEI